ncbi:MAG: integration host factor subunit alpha [Pseudomonadota bacterium]
MTKADLVNKIFEQIGGTKKDAADLVEKLFDLMRDVIVSGESIKVSGFGNFIVRNKKSRVGRNPQTGQTIQISARRVLTFKPSQVLRDAVNKDLS